MQLISRWSGVGIAVVLLCLVAAGGWLYDSQERDLKAKAYEALEFTAESKARELARWRHERLGDAAVLTDNRIFTSAVAQWLAAPNQQGAAAILAALRSLQKNFSYDDILLVDTTGRVRLNLSGRTYDEGEAAKRDRLAALHSGQPALFELHIDADGSEPVMTAVAPLWDHQGETQVAVGAILLEMKASTFLYPLIRSWPTPSSSGETVLVRRDGDSVLYLSELRHRTNTALRLRIPVTRIDVPAVMAILGRKGIVEGIDYRGEEVLSALMPVPGSPWFVVTKIDKREALENWRFRSTLLLAMILSTLVAGIALFVMLWHRNAKENYRLQLKQEAMLRKDEELHRAILLTSRDGFWLLDTDGRLLEVNQAYCRMSGYSEEELLAMRVPDLDTVETAAGIAAHIQRIIEQGEDRFESQHRRKDGTVVDLEIRIEYRPVDGGRLVCFLRDITERKLAEDALKQSHALLSNLATLVPGVVYQYRLYPDGRSAFPYASPGMNDIYEVTPEEVQQDATPVFGRLHPEDYGNVAGAIQESARTLNPFYCEFRVVLPRQGLRWRWSQAHPQLMDDGGTLWHGIISDITERKVAEEEKTQLQAQLQQAQKMESIGRLAGGVAHDFNNLLTVINGYSRLLLQDKSLDESNQHTLTEILKAGERAAGLTAQLLAYSRKQVLQMRPLDLNNTVQQMRSMLQRLVGEDVEVRIALKASAGTVQADPHQLEQVVMNLLVNAKDAMPAGGMVLLETANVELDENYVRLRPGALVGPYVMLAVSDTGTGMDKETQRNIFEPFFTTKGLGKGTGLGLSTVQGIVAQSGGYIDVYSEPGHGTTFKVYLPALAAVAPDAGPPAATPNLRGNETVLVVEDQHGVLEYAVAALSAYGYRVLKAENIAEALHVFEQESGLINLILTDVVMPNGSGRVLADELERRQPGVKILFMSGYTDDAIAHLGVLESGAEFIQKPFSPQQLAAKVRMVLGH